MKSESGSSRAVVRFPVLIVFLLGVIAGAVLDRSSIGAPLMALGRDNQQLNLALIEDAWQTIQAHYVDRSALVPKTLTYGAIAGMTDALGDTEHSAFLTPTMVKEERDSIRGQYVGIGAEVQMKDKQVVVVAPLDGSPAKRAGLRPGDAIVKVNGSSVAGLSLQKVVKQIDGPSGTHVNLTILGTDSDTTRTVTLQRTRVDVKSVSWAMIPGTSVADVRIALFSKRTADELQQALSHARNQGATATVLDLRSDPGGLFSEAIAVASQFLQKGNVVLIKDARGKVTPVAAKAKGEKSTLPMTVLINGGTASAAEIVSGALKDAGRAKLVGEKTFGTGTVLQKFSLPGGSALMLATQEWLTPDGHSIWHQGIAPDLKVALAQRSAALIPAQMKEMTEAAFGASTDIQLKQAVSLLQKINPAA